MERYGFGWQYLGNVGNDLMSWIRMMGSMAGVDFQLVECNRDCPPHSPRRMNNILVAVGWVLDRWVPFGKGQFREVRNFAD